MQRLSRRDFLRYAGLGLIGLPLAGNRPIGRLAKFGTLPPTAKPPKRFATVEEQAQALLTENNLPGVAIGLIRANQLAYARGFGVANVDTGRPMTERSMMCIMSISKTFAGAAVRQLVEAGALSLDDLYMTHVPYFKMVDPRYAEITLRHLLSHTAGMPELVEEHFFDEWADPWYDDGAAERLVRSLYDDGVMLAQDPGGDQFLYSDIGFDILATLIHQVSGELFEDYEQRHIFRPLQMNETTFLMSEVKPKDLVAAHLRDEAGDPIVWDRFPYARQHAPSSDLFTNIVDLSHWVMASMNGGVYHNHRVLQPASQAEIWTPLYNEPWGWTGFGYNSGWFIGSYAEEGLDPVRMICSGGGGPGISTHITIFPDQGLASIVFVNLCAAWDDPAWSWDICDNLAIQMLRGEL